MAVQPNEKPPAEEAPSREQFLKALTGAIWIERPRLAGSALPEEFRIRCERQEDFFEKYLRKFQDPPSFAFSP